MQELVTAIEMKKCKEFDKPIIIYNETGFFDGIINVLNKIYDESFTNQDVKSSYNVVDDYNLVLDLIDKCNVKLKK